MALLCSNATAFNRGAFRFGVQGINCVYHLTAADSPELKGAPTLVRRYRLTKPYKDKMIFAAGIAESGLEPQLEEDKVTYEGSPGLGEQPGHFFITLQRMPDGSPLIRHDIVVPGDSLSDPIDRKYALPAQFLDEGDWTQFELGDEVILELNEDGLKFLLSLHGEELKTLATAELQRLMAGFLPDPQEDPFSFLAVAPQTLSPTLIENRYVVSPRYTFSANSLTVDAGRYSAMVEIPVISFPEAAEYEPDR